MTSPTVALTLDRLGVWSFSLASAGRERRAYDVGVIRRRGGLVGVAVVCGALVSGVSGCGGGEKPAAVVSDTPISAAVGGGEVAGLQGRWWNWAAQSRATNPVSDTTGRHCAQGQPGDVWFVAGTFGGEAVRACTVPAGRPIAGPLLSVVVDDAGSCADFIAASDGEVVLDGSPVDVVKFAPEPVTVRGTVDDPVTNGRGEIAGQACGLWFTLAPLSPGPHKLTITGVSGDFSTSVTYTLTVSV